MKNSRIKGSCRKNIIVKDSERIDINKIEYDKSINFEKFRKIVKTASFTCKYNGKKTTFFYKNAEGNKESHRQQRSVKKILLSKTDFTQLLLDLFGDFIKTFCQNTRETQRSVKTFNFKTFKILFPIIFLSIFAGLFIPFIGTFLKVFIILYYSTCILLKSSFLIYGSIKRDDFADYCDRRNIEAKYKNKHLPKYTILVPMFRENKKTINQAIKSITNLVYPMELLDIKLVLEEDDKQTRKILKKTPLPKNIVPIWTPYFEPRTKPKACNVASLFAEGDILVIFDAEDIPDKLQLLLAVDSFNKNSDVQILQGCLNFYNYHQNLLTELFNIEYNVWFKIALRIFASFGISIPLGGTSNHIRYRYLEQQGFWDSYNVTEDLELSVIADDKKAIISHLNSDTKEWCVLTVRDFIKQRTRWLKGYLLTYFVNFTKTRQRTIKQKIFMHLIVGYSAISFLLTPLLFISVITIHCIYLSTFWACCNFVYYITYIFLYISIIKNVDVILTTKRFLIFAIYPFYFILHTISAYYAIYDIYKNPFRWAKTKHLV